MAKKTKKKPHASPVFLNNKLLRETELCYENKTKNESKSKNESDSENEELIDIRKNINIYAIFQEQFTHYIKILISKISIHNYVIQVNVMRG